MACIYSYVNFLHVVYRYSVDPGDYDPGVGCIVRAITGSLNRDDVEVTRLDQDCGILELVETEELVSNIIEIKPANTEQKFNVRFRYKFNQFSITSEQN